MQEHGTFTLEIVDQTLIVTAVGAWNLETAIRWGQEYKEQVAKIEDKPWGCLVDLTQFELAIPEVWQHVDEINEWSNLHNQRYEAVICSLSIQKTLLASSHEKLTKVESRFCQNIEEAKLWFTQQGVLNRD